MVTTLFTISLKLVERFKDCAGRLRGGSILTYCALQHKCAATHLNAICPIPRKAPGMMKSFEDVSNAGSEFMDSSLKNLASLSKGYQVIAAEAADYSRKAFEAGTATAEKLVSAKSIENAVEIQADYAKQAYEGFVAQATKMSELYAEMAKEAYKPFESVVAKAG